MNNFRKSALALSLSVLATQVVWAEVAEKPTVTNGMVMHLDASDINADGTVDVMGVGEDVTQWKDRSLFNTATHDNNVYPTNTAKPPKRLTYGLNGKPTVAFKESGLVTSTYDQITANTAYTKIVLFKINDLDKDNNLISSSTTALWTGRSADSEKYGTLKSWHDPDAKSFLSGVTPVNSVEMVNNELTQKSFPKDFHIAVTRYVAPRIPTSLPNVLRLDGTEIATNNLLKNHAQSGIQIGSLDNGHFLDGEIAEALVYDRDLSDAEVLNIEAYLKAKWGGFKEQKITLTLGKEKKQIGSKISLTAKSSSALAVDVDTVKSIAVPASSKAICSLEKGTSEGNYKIVLKAVGTCVVQADQDGNKAFRSADTVFSTFKVTAVPATTTTTTPTPTTTTTTTESSGGGGGSTTPLLLMLIGFVSLLRRKFLSV
ncbi:MAG: hypothetical protein V3U87_17485 [Methylococcaceae bacterium]